MDPFSQPPDPHAVAPAAVTDAVTDAVTHAVTDTVTATVTATVVEPEIDAGARPKRGRVIAIIAAVAVVAAGGIVVATNISSSSGGYDSPEAAVDALMSAVDKEDLLGVIDVIRPGERALVRDTMLPLEKEMERLEVLQTDVDMHKVSGIQMKVEGMTTTTEPVGDRVALVTMNSGTLTSSASIADLPLGSLVRDSVKSGGTSQDPNVVQLKGTDVATVKEDGRWYVSYAYSIAEAARRAAHKPVPDFAHPIPAVGAADPEAAARGMITALASLKLSDAIGLLAPSEFGALQDYGTLFVPEAQRQIDQWKSDNQFTVTVTPGTAKVDQQGDRATVAFEQFTVTGNRSADTFKVVLDARCVTADTTIDGDTKHQHICVGDNTAADSANVPADVKPTLERLKALSLRAVVVKENGHWYVAPIRSWFDLLEQVLKSFASGDDAKAFAKWLSSSLTGAIDNAMGVGGSTTTNIYPGGDLSGPLTQDLLTLDGAYRAHMTASGTAADTLKALTDIPSTIRFFDSSMQLLPAGDFTDVAGAESTLATPPVCMMLSFDPQTPGIRIPCPTN